MVLSLIPASDVDHVFNVAYFTLIGCLLSTICDVDRVCDGIVVLYICDVVCTYGGADPAGVMLHACPV